MKDEPICLEGGLIAPDGAKVAIVASRFNHFIVDRLIDGAQDALVRHGVSPKNVLIVRVPGAWELPPVVQRIARSKRVDAVIALGAVIRGQTPHFEYVAGEATKGLAHVAMNATVPVAFGVLTTDTIEQAIERAGAKAGNKGWDCALCAIEILTLGRALNEAGL